MGSTRTLAVLPLVDWYAAGTELRGEPGVSYLVRTDRSTVLFDVGANLGDRDPSPLVANMQRLGISLSDVDTLVLSQCEHGCVYCVGGETPILMADGTQRPMAGLQVGDEIYGTEKRGHYRRYIRTRVLAHWRTSKPAWRVRLADGTELTASADHRFLTERGWKFVARDEGGASVRTWPSITP